ncbi:serine hydrolase domain-containing protein [Streptomyces sp. NPDC049881]|uniref:serine hydrolase domain-containing protein n=1 Tax=Streptomyces sp. NPDC049881 TaxID=3155778 RepID=UPI00343ECA13
MRRSRSMAAAVLVACALVSTATATAATAAPPAAGDAPGADALQAALDRVRETGAIGAIAEVRQGDAVWRGSSGTSRLGGRLPAPVDGRFRAGSVTKTFTATVVLQLVGEGRLGLSDPVGRWLPGLIPSEGADRITVRDLLRHSSGLPDYTEGLIRGGGLLAERFRTWTADEMVRRAVRDADGGVRPLLFPPGTRHAYSNTDYVVLGMLVDEVTGHDYRTEIDRRVLRPLGLDDTRMPGSSPFLRGPHSHGYEALETPYGTLPLDYTTVNMSVAGAAGEIVSTTADLDRFFAALLGGELLEPAELREMTTDSLDDGWGLGVELVDLPCGPAVGHAGGAPGYSTASYHSADGTRQVTVSWTDWGGDADDVSLDMVTAALCPA